MVRFLGHIEAKMDVKGRVFVPALYRKQLEKTGETCLIMQADYVNHCLKFYPESVWEELDRQFTSKLNMWDQKDLALYRQFTASVEPVEMDSNGRILLQKKYAEMIGVEADTLFVGVGNYFEVWDKNRFDNQMSDTESFAKAMQDKMGNQDTI